MLNFASDYTQGCHENILNKLSTINLEMNTGYGTDTHCEKAKELIKKATNCKDAEISFLVGGTQTNQTIIASMLHNTEGVIAATTGHINCHEAGAIEYSGYKVLTVPSYDGKIKAQDVKKLLEIFYGDSSHDHMVYPGMVYISHPTEYGTLYTKKELEDIKEVCTEYEIPLFLDGARLGYGLRAKDTDITLEDIAKLTDVFYIGGTKVGALFGEAVVFTHHNMPKRFLTTTKQHGALLAKGWLLGAMFETLFTDDLYMTISDNAIDRAKELREIFLSRGFQLFIDSPTNQQFFVMEDTFIEKLEKEVTFSWWERVDETHSAVRFATSWATTKENLSALAKTLDKMM